MKIIIISDLHFGVHSNSYEWLEIQEQYFNEWFIPLVKKTLKEDPESILVCGGDIFESKQILNVRVLNSVMEIFSRLGKLLPVHIILGNHDIFVKTSNDIHSLKSLDLLDNITVHEQPKVLKLDNKKIYLMPWRFSREQEKECIQEAINKKCSYMFCHTDFVGVKYNRYSTSTLGNQIEDYKGIEKVFSGHIHYRQEKDNVIIVGCPYQLNKGDKGNQKGIYILDNDSGEIEFIPNHLSPKYVTLDLGSLLELTLEEYKEKTQNNFVEIEFTKDFASFPFYKITDDYNYYRSVELCPKTKESAEAEMEEDDDDLGDFTHLKKFNLLELIDTYIETVDSNKLTKTRLKSIVEELFNKTIKDEAF